MLRSLFRDMNAFLESAEQHPPPAKPLQTAV